MRTISTGEPSNLATYRKIAYVIGGFKDDSEPVKFIDEKIKDSPSGELEEVVVDECQVLHLLFDLARKDALNRDQN